MPSYRIVAIIKQTSLGFLSQILTNPEKIKKKLLKTFKKTCTCSLLSEKCTSGHTLYHLMNGSISFNRDFTSQIDKDLHISIFFLNKLKWKFWFSPDSPVMHKWFSQKIIQTKWAFLWHVLHASYFDSLNTKVMLGCCFFFLDKY